jgi:hypothetical protein
MEEERIVIGFGGGNLKGKEKTWNTEA